MDIHRNNAFSLTAMEAAFNHGEEWLEQLLPYLSANFDFVADYCREHIPQIKTCAPDATYLMWLDCRALGLDNDALRRQLLQLADLGFLDQDNCRAAVDLLLRSRLTEATAFLLDYCNRRWPRETAGADTDFLDAEFAL